MNTEDIVVVRMVRNEQSGDAVVASEHVLHDCIVAPAGSVEDISRGEQITTSFNIYALAGADILATDRVRRAADPAPAGSTNVRVVGPWQVIGEPTAWKSPWVDWSPGVVVNIKRAG